jgi:type I restriction enzyme R subunit
LTRPPRSATAWEPASPALVRSVDSMSDYDLYDVLGRLAYPLTPQTRRQRAAAFPKRKTGWLVFLPPEAAQTVTALAAQFAKSGVEALESPELFQIPTVERAGGLRALRDAGNPADLIREMKMRLG